MATLSDYGEKLKAFDESEDIQTLLRGLTGDRSGDLGGWGAFADATYETIGEPSTLEMAIRNRMDVGNNPEIPRTAYAIDAFRQPPTIMNKIKQAFATIMDSRREMTYVPRARLPHLEATTTLSEEAPELWQFTPQPEVELHLRCRATQKEYHIPEVLVINHHEHRDTNPLSPARLRKSRLPFGKVQSTFTMPYTSPNKVGMDIPLIGQEVRCFAWDDELRCTFFMLVTSMVISPRLNNYIGEQEEFRLLGQSHSYLNAVVTGRMVRTPDWFTQSSIQQYHTKKRITSTFQLPLLNRSMPDVNDDYTAHLQAQGSGFAHADRLAASVASIRRPAETFTEFVGQGQQAGVDLAQGPSWQMELLNTPTGLLTRRPNTSTSLDTTPTIWATHMGLPSAITLRWDDLTRYGRLFRNFTKKSLHVEVRIPGENDQYGDSYRGTSGHNEVYELAVITDPNAFYMHDYNDTAQRAYPKRTIYQPDQYQLYYVRKHHLIHALWYYYNTKCDWNIWFAEYAYSSTNRRPRGHAQGPVLVWMGNTDMYQRRRQREVEHQQMGIHPTPFADYSRDYYPLRDVENALQYGGDVGVYIGPPNSLHKETINPLLVVNSRATVLHKIPPSPLEALWVFRIRRNNRATENRIVDVRRNPETNRSVADMHWEFDDVVLNVPSAGFGEPMPGVVNFTNLM